MATTKLYPPILAGTTPPFFDSVEGTILSVPFSMNATVSSSEIGGVKLRIRNANNDQELGYIDAYEWSNNTAYFNLDAIKEALILASYYKIQLAYVDTYNNVGYYSTLSIVKYTAQPTVSIVGLNGYESNLHTIAYTGLYSNLADSSEKNHQYKFTLYDMNNKVIQTSDWQVHNTNNDTSSWQSTDMWLLNYTINSDEKYKLQYSVITNNNLRVDSIMYLIVGQAVIPPEIDVVVHAECDYDEGNIAIHLSPPTDIWGTEILAEDYTGSFLIARSSAKDGFRAWVQLATFKLAGKLNRNVLYRDFTAEQGETYLYCIQQFNSKGLYSSRICSEPVVSGFEDAFLYDGKRQLKIRFNPKVTSFKAVHQENKKNTLGSKYPFFFRNGRVDYKEFPISGLISYLSDDNSYFMSRTEELNMPIDWDDITDITDENLLYERRFKMKVMEWLNNGEIKLFRSPGEGNYLVRLLNVSLSPNDTVSRMLHTFTCTADEIDECTPTTLAQYGFFGVDITAIKELQYYTIVFKDEIQDIIARSLTFEQNVNEATTTQINKALAAFSNMDLLKGNDLQYIKFENCANLEFTLGGQRYIVGSTGTYEMTFEETQQVLRIPRKTLTGANNTSRRMNGQVTVGVWSNSSSKFNNASFVTQYDKLDYPRFDGQNYMNQINYIGYTGAVPIPNIKDKISVWYKMKFSLLTGVYNYSTFASMRSDSGFRLASSDVIVANRRWNIVVETASGAKTLLEMRASNASEPKYYDGALFYVSGTNTYYQIQGTQFVALNAAPSVVVREENEDGELVNKTYVLSPTQVCVDNTIYDLGVMEGRSLEFPIDSPMPTQIYWGQKVQPEFLYQFITVKYTVEDNITNVEGQNYTLSQRQAQLQPLQEATAANALNYLCVINPEFYSTDNVNYLSHLRYQNVINPTYVTNLVFKDASGNERSFMTVESLVANTAGNEYDLCSLFYWDNGHFCRMTHEQQALFVGDMVWIPKVLDNYYGDYDTSTVNHPAIDADRAKYEYYRDVTTELNAAVAEGG